MKCVSLSRCRLQNKGPQSQDQHLYQDACSRWRADFCYYWSPRGRLRSEARNTGGCRAFYPNSRLPQKQHRQFAIECIRLARRGEQSYDSRESSVQSRGSCRRAEGRHGETNTTNHQHLHSHPFPRPWALFRGDGVARQRRQSQEGDWELHRTSHWR